MTLQILSFDNHEVPPDYERSADQLIAQCYDIDDTALDAHQVQPSETHRVFLALDTHARIVGHLAAYIRDTEQNGATLTLGMIGDVATAPAFRRRGVAKALLRATHSHFEDRQIAFSILFAYDPDVYKSSGYQLMENEVHFQDCDGDWKTFVYEGSMYHALSDRPWSSDLIDLKGNAV